KRPAGRTAELITVELRFRDVEEIARVQRAVPQELKRISVKIIGAGLEDRGHHAARRSTVLSGVLVGEHAEFPDRLHAEIDIQTAAGTGIGKVIDDEAVHEEDVARWTIPGDGERQTVSARRT